jgi:hypothetical protein
MIVKPPPPPEKIRLGGSGGVELSISSKRVFALIYTRTDESLPFTMHFVNVIYIFWDFPLASDSGAFLDL